MTRSPTEARDVAVEALATAMVARSPEEAARTLERFSGADVAEVLADLEVARAAPVLHAMSTPAARDALLAMSLADAANLVNRLPAPWIAALLRAAPTDRVEQLLALLPASYRSAVLRALEHRAGTAGALIEPDILSVADDVDVAFTLQQVRMRTARARDRVYVTGRDGTLVGVAGLSDLLLAEPHARIDSLMNRKVISLRHDDDATAIAANPGWLSWRMLPVVNDEGTLLGVVRYDLVKRLLLDRPPTPLAASLPVALAELFWLGMIGITDGLARSVIAPEEKRER